MSKRVHNKRGLRVRKSGKTKPKRDIFTGERTRREYRKPANGSKP